MFPFESGARVFNNAGTFRKSGGTGLTIVESTFTNTGTVDVESGNIRFDSGFTSNSAITTGPAGTLTWINSPNTLNDGATITGAGSAVVVGSVTINGTVSADTLTLPTSGTLDDEGVLNVTNTFSWTGGSLNGPGIVNVLADKTLNITGSDVRVHRTGTINNAGTIAISGGYGFGESGGATLNNLATGLVDVQTDVGIGLFVSESGGRTLNNYGIVRKSGGTGTTLIESFFTNSGTLDIESGNVRFDSGLANNSAITTASGTTLTWNGSSNTLNAGSTITGAGSAVITHGTLTTEGVESADNLTLTSGGNLITDAGSTLTIGHGFVWHGSAIGGTGSIYIPSASTMTIDGGFIQRQNTINNAGSAIVTAGFYQSQGAVFNTLAGGTFDLQADVGVGLFPFESGGRTITNAGTFKKSAGSGTATVGATFTNSGSIQALSGTIGFVDAYTQTGGSLVLNGGSVSTNSTLNIQGPRSPVPERLAEEL